ncbi:MAG: hypothetical protein HKL85_09000 [Acidimicrobiaceae bacterium]|nr:hypothetical protein [Acidimicrobiaceae bacterium]
MIDHVPNPLAYAIEEFNVAINTHGDFTYVRFGRDLEILRLRLQGGDDAQLVRRLTDLDAGVTSLFVCPSTGALILVRENHLCDVEDCEFEMGDVSIAATSHENLMATITLLEFDRDDPDDFLGSIHPE